ncbi:hypothetical protein HYZ64_03675 [Candidatus Berkelbacteria bacterium]|nr:hypothetical protein [Candidatus Berkelbacteria bacterium]
MKAQKLKSSKAQSGSAIILALLIVSAVSVAAFSAARVLISEIKIESGLEDASGAYLAAEASLESSLVEYRKDRNYQVSQESTTTSPRIPFQDGIGNLFDGSPREVDLGSDLSGQAQAGELVYFNGVSPSSSPTEIVQVDELIERDISALQLTTPSGVQNNNNCGATTGSDLKFCWHWASTDPKREMEIVLLDRAGNVLPGFPIFEPGTERIISIPPNAAILRFRPLRSSLAPVGTPGTPGYKPAYAFNSFGKPMDMGITRIEATGRFGRSQRKMKIEINRRSDGAIGEFDFAVFSGSDL